MAGVATGAEGGSSTLLNSSSETVETVLASFAVVDEVVFPAAVADRDIELPNMNPNARIDGKGEFRMR